MHINVVLMELQRSVFRVRFPGDNNVFMLEIISKMKQPE